MDIARNVRSILEQYCLRVFHNGPSCNFGAALLGLAKCLANASTVYINTNLKLDMKSLGGQAPSAGSNTRVAYMWCSAPVGNEALDPNTFCFYDEEIGALWEHYIDRKEPCPTTSLTPDFGAVYNSVPYINGEAKSANSIEELEMLKQALGASQVLNYMRTTYTVYLTESKMTLTQFNRIDDGGYIGMKNDTVVYNERRRYPIKFGNRTIYCSKDPDVFAEGVMQCIVRLSNVVHIVEKLLVDPATRTQGKWDNPASVPPDWSQKCVRKGIFEFQKEATEEMDEALIECVKASENNMFTLIGEIGGSGDTNK